MAYTVFDQWSRQSNKLTMAPFLELNAITTRLYSDLFKQNMQILTELAQTGQQHIKTLSEAKGPEQVLKTQVDFLAQTAPYMLGHIEQLIDTAVNSAGEYREWFEHSVETLKPDAKGVSEKNGHDKTK